MISHVSGAATYGSEWQYIPSGCMLTMKGTRCFIFLYPNSIFLHTSWPARWYFLSISIIMSEGQMVKLLSAAGLTLTPSRIAPMRWVQDLTVICLMTTLVPGTGRSWYWWVSQSFLKPNLNLLKSLSPSLLQKIKTTIVECGDHTFLHNWFVISLNNLALVSKWEDQLRKWELGHSQPNPFEGIFKGMLPPTILLMKANPYIAIVTNHPHDLRFPLLIYANNPSPPLSSSIPMPNTITPRNTKVLLVPWLAKTPSPCPDIASSQ